MNEESSGANLCRNSLHTLSVTTDAVKFEIVANALLDHGLQLKLLFNLACLRVYQYFNEK